MSAQTGDIGSFLQDGQSFLKRLKRNNNTAWFDKNRNEYKTSVQGPAKIFAEQLAGRLSQSAGHQLQPKIFRINRDLRFSKEKTPYKPHVHMTFSASLGAGKPIGPAFFFGLETERIVFGAGCFVLEKAALDAYRRAVAENATGAALVATLRRLEKKGAGWSDPELKRVPAGFDPEHKRADLLRRKSLAVWLEFPDPNAFVAADPTGPCARQLRVLMPVYQWLRNNAR